VTEDSPPPINYAGTNYDALETALSERLNLKTILVRDWETPTTLLIAESDAMSARMYGTSEEKLALAEAKLAKAEEAVLASLRAKVAERDAVVASDLSENDLRSLKKVGHVTLRGGNSEPEQAVLIFDPDPAATNKLLRLVLQDHFDSAWKSPGQGGGTLKVAEFIENFDITAEDLRIYRAVHHVRYALQNQTEFSNRDKHWYFEPAYYNFAQLARTSRDSSLWIPDSSRALAEVAKKYELDERFNWKELGVMDDKLVEKLTLGAAIQGLAWSASPPTEAFARLGLADSVDPQEMNDIQDGLRRRLGEKLAQHRDKQPHEYNYAMDSSGLRDFRVLFPIFREVYAEDTSTGPARQYLDTINAGLQKWFPTLTNGPVPDLGDNSAEPPRSLAATQPTAENKLKKAFKPGAPAA